MPDDPRNKKPRDWYDREKGWMKTVNKLSKDLGRPRQCIEKIIELAGIEPVVTGKGKFVPVNEVTQNLWRVPARPRRKDGSKKNQKASKATS